MRVWAYILLLSSLCCGQITKSYWYQSYPRDTAVYAKVRTKAIETGGLECDYYRAVKDPTGFVNRTTSVLSFIDASRTFTISPAVDSFVIYSSGKARVFKVAQSIVIANVIGAHYIYFDSTGVIRDSTFNYYTGSSFIAIVYWDGSKGAVYDERHGCNMSQETHAYLHSTIGTRYERNGLAGSFGNSSFTISAGAIWDEDLRHSISSTTTGIILYRNGANFTWTTTSVPFYNYAGDIYYDNGGTLTAVPSNNYMAVFCIVTNDMSNPIKFILGQRVDVTLANSKANNSFSNLVLTGLPVAEYRHIYTIYCRNDATPVEEVVDYRQDVSLGTGFTSNSHLNLNDLNTANYWHPTKSEYDSTWPTLVRGKAEIDSLVGDIKIGEGLSVAEGVRSDSGIYAYDDTEHGSYVGLFKSIGALPGEPDGYYPVLKTDNAYLFFSTNNKNVGSIGNNGTTTSITLLNSGATAVAISLSSGTSFFNGGKVAIGKTTATTTLDVAGAITADTLKINHRIVGIADTGSYVCSLFEGTTFRVTASYRIQYSITKSEATIKIPNVTTTFAGAATGIIPLPSGVTPVDNYIFPVLILSGGTWVVGQVSIDNDSKCRISLLDRYNLASGTCGIAGTTTVRVVLNN